VCAGLHVNLSLPLAKTAAVHRWVLESVVVEAVWPPPCVSLLCCTAGVQADASEHGLVLYASEPAVDARFIGS
jgi:hypothetical protein